jgi:hypothetical protein
MPYTLPADVDERPVVIDGAGVVGSRAEPSGVASIDPAVSFYQPRCRDCRLLPSTGSPAAIHAFFPSPYSRTFA